jgi:YidC/Oxa1 family membrane protein insertase
VIRWAPSDLDEGPETYSEKSVAWVGVKNKYFSAVLEPASDGLVTAARISNVTDTNIATSLESRILNLAPGTETEDDYIFFLGPNDAELLANEPYTSFAGLHDLQWPEPVTKLFTWLLNTMYAVTRNYGLAIILLTLVVRLALHPLTRKSQKSMHSMQKLSPKMKEIKDKFKDDKKRQQEEIMKLYREHGVNPMGGCLPILLQLPILIGLLGALRSSISLRQEPFVLWINDLSQPDALAMLPKAVPLLGGGPFNLLPLILMATMFLQQKLTPKPGGGGGDAQAEQTQKMMMYMMPAMFGVIFYGMPSGLVLYFMTSTGLGALESWLIRRHLNKVEALPAKKKPSKKKKETWVERAARAKAGRSRKLK